MLLTHRPISHLRCTDALRWDWADGQTRTRSGTRLPGGGAWKASTPSYKFYYENVKLHGGKTLTLDADKNSYFVVT